MPLAARRLAGLLGLAVWCGAAGTVGAQTPPADTPVVLRPAPELAPLAGMTAAVLQRRTGRPVVVGSAPPAIPEAVAQGEVALVPEGGEVALVVGGRGGRSHTLSLPVEPSADEASARALALAYESLSDRAEEPVAAEVPPPAGGSWVLTHPDEVLRARPRAPSARPTLYLRMLFGVSPLRGTPLVGPGAGLGLCVGVGCLVMEADMPLVAERTRYQGEQVFSYRSVDTAMRLVFRPLTFGEVTLGGGFGMLSRMGTARLVGTEQSRTVTNFGVRSTAEVAWRFSGPFEWVFEAGLDYAVTRARFLRSDGIAFLEDRWRPWLVTSLRLRP